MVDVRHPSPRGFLRDRVLGLLLGADEEHGLTFGGLLAYEAHGLVEPAHGLLEIDDVNTVAFGENEWTHARVPAARLVAEMDASFKQRLHLYRCGHSFSLETSVRSSAVALVNPRGHGVRTATACGMGINI